MNEAKTERRVRAGTKLKAEEFATIQAVPGLSCMQLEPFPPATFNRP